jgi:hypothetical protein
MLTYTSVVMYRLSELVLSGDGLGLAQVSLAAEQIVKRLSVTPKFFVPKIRSRVKSKLNKNTSCNRRLRSEAAQGRSSGTSTCRKLPPVGTHVPGTAAVKLVKPKVVIVVVGVVFVVVVVVVVVVGVVVVFVVVVLALNVVL